MENLVVQNERVIQKKQSLGLQKRSKISRQVNK